MYSYSAMHSSKKVLLMSCIRAVLVFFKTLKDLKAFREWIPQTEGLKSGAHVFTEETPIDQRSDMVELAVQSGHVTLLTKELGRGTDFSSQGNTYIILLVPSYQVKMYQDNII